MVFWDQHVPLIKPALINERSHFVRVTMLIQSNIFVKDTDLRDKWYKRHQCAYSKITVHKKMPT